MNGGIVLDLALVAVLLAYAVSGWRQGLVVSVLSLVGFLGGGAVGMLVLPGLVARLTWKLEYLGWIEDLPEAPVRELPDYMLVGRRVLSPEDLEDLPQPNTDFLRRRP